MVTVSEITFQPVKIVILDINNSFLTCKNYNSWY